MKHKNNHLRILAIGLALSLAFSALVFPIGIVSATDAWYDDFTGPWDNTRWTNSTGNGTIFQISEGGDTYLTAASFTPAGEYNSSRWYGPSTRAELPLSGPFNISTVLKCQAEIQDYSLVRVEVKLFDTTGSQVYAFGWGDEDTAYNHASIYLNGRDDQHRLFETEDGVAYTIFYDKEISLERTETQLKFYLEGELVYTSAPSSRSIKYLELAFLRTGVLETYCTPDVRHINSINVQTTPATEPDPPENLIGTGTDGEVGLSWSAPYGGGAEITNYKIFRGTISGSLNLLTTIGSQTSYTDTGVSNGQKYYYAVSALNEVGESGMSVEASATPIAVPDAPASLQSIAGDDHVLLSWDIPTFNGGDAITNYTIYRSQSLDSPQELASLGAQYSYNDTDVVFEQVYYYWVSATNSAGEGDLSSEAIASIGAPVTLPSEPRNPDAVDGNGVVELSWNSPISNGNSPILRYSVYRGIEEGAMSILANSSQTSYIDEDVMNGQKYYYSVSAWNVLGEGNSSDSVACTPVSYSAPSAPVSLEIVPGYGFISLIWAAPIEDGGSDITAYHVYRGETPDSMAMVSTLGNALSYMDLGLTNGIEYHYAVSASNSEGEGNLSATVNATPGQSIPVGDIDGDGVPDNIDAFPTDPNESVDTDGDGIGDNADDDNTPPDDNNTTDTDDLEKEVSLTSTIVTFIVFVVMAIVGVMFMIKPKEPE